MKPVKLRENTGIDLSLKNLISIIIVSSLAVWGYFGIVERLNSVETQQTMMVADLEQNTEFRIKWPRGELGSPPADSEQFMLIEHIAGQLESIQEQMENMMNNGVNIKRLQEDVKILRDDVEKLKDSNRSIIYQNGNGKKQTYE